MGAVRFACVLSCLAAVVGCGGGDGGDRCEGVTCPVIGTVCDPTDGQCRCGSGGPVCSEGETCDAGAATCSLADPCVAVTCDVAGTRCDPADGQCRCGAGGPVCETDQTCDAVASVCRAPGCTGGTRYAPGTTVFRDVTEAWGLNDVVGTRVAVTDIDGDAYPDLFVRRGGNGSEDFAPGGTRRSWLLRNRGAVAGFEDVTERSGIRQTRTHGPNVGRPGEVVASADVDNDGDLDIYTGMFTGVDDALEGETSELMLNDGQGRFTFTPEDNPLRRADGADSVGGASFVDYDRDGNVDLWIGHNGYVPAGSAFTQYQQDRLFEGDGTGRFTDVTEQAGLTTEEWSSVTEVNQAAAHSVAWSALACDLNDDGTPELMAASYGRAPNHLWLGRRAGTSATYSNRSIESGYAFDGDEDWTSNQFARCYCSQNRGAQGCAGVGAANINCPGDIERYWRHSLDRNPYRLGGNSGTTVCADVDNDGRMDLMTHEITHWWAGSNADRSELLLNTGDDQVRFDRPGLVPTGLERGNPQFNWDNGDMTGAVFDFDNDAWPDIYIGASDYPGNHGLLFHQEAPRSFSEVPVIEGIDHNRSHGIAVADFDRDGDLDVVVGHSRARCDASAPNDCYPTQQVRLFENLLGDQGNWVQLKLQGGPGTNRAAIGARVTVTAGSVIQTQEVGGGHGHYGLQHDLTLHFGLGAACEAEVTVRWPDAALTEQQFTVVTGARYRVVQGNPPEPL